MIDLIKPWLKLVINPYDNNLELARSISNQSWFKKELPLTSKMMNRKNVRIYMDKTSKEFTVRRIKKEFAGFLVRHNASRKDITQCMGIVEDLFDWSRIPIVEVFRMFYLHTYKTNFVNGKEVPKEGWLHSHNNYNSESSTWSAAKSWCSVAPHVKRLHWNITSRERHKPLTHLRRLQRNAGTMLSSRITWHREVMEHKILMEFRERRKTLMQRRRENR